MTEQSKDMNIFGKVLAPLIKGAMAVQLGLWTGLSILTCLPLANYNVQGRQRGAAQEAYKKIWDSVQLLYMHAHIGELRGLRKLGLIDSRYTAGKTELLTNAFFNFEKFSGPDKADLLLKMNRQGALNDAHTAELLACTNLYGGTDENQEHRIESVQNVLTKWADEKAGTPVAKMSDFAESLAMIFLAAAPSSENPGVIVDYDGNNVAALGFRESAMTMSQLCLVFKNARDESGRMLGLYGVPGIGHATVLADVPALIEKIKEKELAFQPAVPERAASSRTFLRFLSQYDNKPA